jgi:hypothetical protein
MCCCAFIKSRRDPRFKNVERVYKVGKIWYAGAVFMAIFEFFFMIPGLLYYVYITMGLLYVFVGIAATFAYVPCWLLIQYWNHTHHPEVSCGINFGAGNGKKEAAPIKGSR